MRSRTLCSILAMLLLECREVSTQDDGYHSFGQVSPCQNSRLTNATSFNASLTPDNSTLAFEFSGLDTVAGNATLEIAVEADGDEVYKATLDPCSFPVPDLCPASIGVASLSHINLDISENSFDFTNLSTRTDVKARLYLDITGTDSRLHSTCAEMALRSDASDLGGTASIDGSSSNNNTTTSGDGIDPTSSTANDDGNASSTSVTTQNSGAGTLQAAWCLVLYVLTCVGKTYSSYC